MNLKKVNPKLLQLVTIALSIILALNLFVFFAALFEEVIPYKPSEDSVLYSLESGNYIWLRNDLAYYTPEGIEKNATLRECYALQCYFENSIFHHAYQVTGDTAQAEHTLALCQENAANAGELSFYLAQIDALFD